MVWLGAETAVSAKCRKPTSASAPLSQEKQGRVGKCDAFRTGNASDAVYGALFEIPKKEKRKLDRTEGLGSGYHEQSVQVVLPNGKQMIAQTYFADFHTRYENLRRYFWYKEFVTKGAEEHHLPQDYIDLYINIVPGVADRDAARRTRSARNSARI